MDGGGGVHRVDACMLGRLLEVGCIDFAVAAYHCLGQGGDRAVTIPSSYVTIQ